MSDPGRARRAGRVAAAGLLCLAGALAGCGQDGGGGGGDSGDPATGRPRPAATFESTLTRVGDRLEVTYRLTNRGKGDLLVVDLSRAPSGTPGATTAAAYVTGGTGATRDSASTLVVSRRLFPNPPDAESAAPRTAGVSLLEPGRTAQGRFTVALQREAPYAASEGGPPALADSPTQARFCLGVLAEPWPRGAKERLRGQERAQLPHVRAYASKQYLFCSDRVSLKS